MIIGIDLGTTFSLTSYINASGMPTLCPTRNDASAFSTPSIVHIGENGALVGELVESLLSEDASLPHCRFAKLSMGKSEASVYQDHQNIEYTPEAISALVLRKMKIDAEAALGEEVTGAVITVPANFNEVQRKATVDAGRLANIPVLGLVEEPLAAAAYFGIETSQNERLIFVFDIGGGTLDATLLSATPEGLYAIATEGADNIGGKNFDEVIMDIVLDQFMGQFRRDIREDSQAMSKLRQFATATKIELSAPGNGIVSKPLILAGESFRVTFNRAQFEDAAEPWLEACEEVCERTLKSQSLAWEDIDELILTGGSSLLPCVERKVREMSGLPPHAIKRDQPHASVAYGAALLAEQFYGTKETVAPPLKQMVTSNELGMRVFDREKKKAVFHAMIDKNEPLPVSFKQTFFTQKDEQRNVELEILQRKDEFTAPETLGKFKFGPIRKPENGYPIEIMLGYDETGRVKITAKDNRTGETMEQEMTDEEASDLNRVYQLLESLVIRS